MIIIHPRKMFTFTLGILLFAFCIIFILAFNTNEVKAAIGIVFFSILGSFSMIFPFIYRIHVNEKGIIVKFNKSIMFWITFEPNEFLPWSKIKRIEWWGGNIFPMGGYHFVFYGSRGKEIRMPLNWIFCNREKAMKIILPNVDKSKVAPEILKQYDIL